MNGGIFSALAFSLAATVVLESGVFFLMGKRNRKDFLLVIMVNVLTNPAVVLLYWLTVLYTPVNTVFATAVLELAAFAVEGYYYKKYGQEFRHPYLFSLAANLFSFIIGGMIL